MICTLDQLTNLLVYFGCFEWASVVIQRFIRHFFEHENRQSKFAQNPFGPVARWVGMSLYIEMEEIMMGLSNKHNVLNMLENSSDGEECYL